MITIAGCISAGVIVYSLLTYLFVVPKISVPTSIAISLIIFGLTKYYSAKANYAEGRSLAQNFDGANDVLSGFQDENSWNKSSILFAIIFATVLVISALGTKEDNHLFIGWNEVGGTHLIQLGAAITLCYFIPGYAVVLMIAKNSRINPILVVLLGYLMSMLITGITAYISALSFGVAISESKNLFILVYLGIFVTYFVYTAKSRIRISRKTEIKRFDIRRLVSTWSMKTYNYLNSKASELLVFGGLLMLLVISTYLLYNGTTIGDQWFHQGRALLFLSGSFREALLSNAETLYPPFQSALLAALTSLSGMPLVNSFASIAFLNITALFAFYYFFSVWITPKSKKAGLLACALFMIGSGFGWIYLLAVTVPVHGITSAQSSVEILKSLGSMDIISTSNFVIPSGPDFSTGLIYIALPAGFVLLAMVRTTIGSKTASTSIVAAISTLGMISHDEFHIFIIIASLLPLFFKLKEKNYLYLGILLAFLVVYAIDLVSPAKFFTTNTILDFPLFFLSLVFTTIAWIIYLKRENLYRALIIGKSFSTFFKGKIPKPVIRILLVCIIVYLYSLSFVVISQLPITTIQAQESGSAVPWYLYPMKMGLVGLLGLALTLTFLFKRSEKLIFVFGLLILISVIAGPFYNEYRFSKYTMIGFIGFASVMGFHILVRLKGKEVYNLTIIGSIIILSGISMFFFVGFNSLILQTQDFYDTFPRRHFPSITELNLFENLRNHTDLHAERYNVISFPSEYNRWRDGMMAKIQGFAGLPNGKLFGSSPLVLNASTLESFYRLLDSSNAKYILIPKATFQDKTLAETAQFAITNFPSAFDYGKYVVIDVPPLQGPSKFANDVAFINNKKIPIVPKPDNGMTLQFENRSFNSEDRDTKFGDILMKNQTENAILNGTNPTNETTLWSRNLDTNDSINYISAKFKIIDDNRRGDSVGIKWLEKNKIYVANLSGRGLELMEQDKTNNDKVTLLSQNLEVPKVERLWNILKIVLMKDSINIYVDDKLKIKFPRLESKESPERISKIGISSINNVVELEPIQIGMTSSKQISNKGTYYDYYYPLNVLALSGSSYGTFVDSDYSSLSSKTIILPSDPQQIPQALFNLYLDYVDSGGRLIVFNSDDSFRGNFSRLLSINPNGNMAHYARISGQNSLHSFLNISGKVKAAEAKPSPGVKVIGTYGDGDNNTIAPFAIEKDYSNNGKIILINDKGYFNSIFSNPERYFLTLSNISSILDLNLSKAPNIQNLSTRLKGYIGNMELSGDVELNSTSFSILNSSGNSYKLGTSKISIYDKNDNLRSYFKNSTIENLKLFGKYRVTINSNGTMSLPSGESINDYLGISLPENFNMTVKLLNNYSRAEIVTNNHSQHYTIGNESKIVFSNITAISFNSIPVLVKNPEVKVIGNASFQNALFSLLTVRGGLNSGQPLDLQGQLRAKVDFVDHYKEPYQNGTRTKYLTYFQSVIMDGKINNYAGPLKLPGDISYQAKLKQLGIPLRNILISNANVALLTIITLVGVVGSWLLWPKLKPTK